MDSNGDRNGIKNPEIEEQNACEGLLHKKNLQDNKNLLNKPRIKQDIQTWIWLILAESEHLRQMLRGVNCICTVGGWTVMFIILSWEALLSARLDRLYARVHIGIIISWKRKRRESCFIYSIKTAEILTVEQLIVMAQRWSSFITSLLFMKEMCCYQQLEWLPSSEKGNSPASF